MNRKKKQLDIFEETKQKAKKLNSDYQNKFNDLSYEVFKKQSNVLKANLLLKTIVETMLDHQVTKNNVNALPKDLISSTERKIHYKKLIENQKKYDLERLTISGLWMSMSAFLVLLFIKKCLTNKFLISFSVDLLVAAIAIVFVFKGVKTHLQLTKRYNLSFKSFSIVITGVAISLVITLLTLKSPFDITFLIIMVAHFTSKKIFTTELLN